MSKFTNIEHLHQCTVIQWARLQNINDWLEGDFEPDETIADFLCAIPNGGHRHKNTAKDLKAEGVKAGMPDLFLFIPRETYAGLFIEMKKPAMGNKPKGQLNAAQKIILPRLTRMNYKTVVCYTSAEAICWIETYLEGL